MTSTRGALLAEGSDSPSGAASVRAPGRIRRHPLVRPPGVGADYLPTPHGWRHRSCVLEVGPDDVVHGDHIERSDGSRREVPPCGHPAFDHRGQVVPASRPMPAAPPTGDHAPEVDGWVAYVASTATGPVNLLTAQWSVPDAPAAVAGQVIYMFPGLEPLSTGDVILQPVLAWNGFDDNAWTIASWACCAKDNGFHSSPLTVSPGDLLLGNVSGQDCDATGVCARWNIVTRDHRTRASTSFQSVGTGAPMDWVFGGALEVFGVTSCDQYPASGRVRFDAIRARALSGDCAQPQWSPWTDSQAIPECQMTFGAPERRGPVSAWGLSWSTAPDGEEDAPAASL